MNAEQMLNTYTIMIALTVALILWILVSFWKKPSSHSVYLLTTGQENLTGLGAWMMALCSVGLSIGFALTLATNFIIGVLFTVLFLGFCVAEFTASFHLAKAWAQRRLGRVISGLWLLVGGVCISIIAGQSMIAQKVDEAEAQRMQASDAYQQAIAARETAQAEVKSLVVDESAVTAATATLTRLQTELATLNDQKAQAIQKREACPANWFTKCINPANAEIKHLEGKIAIAQEAVTREQALLAQHEKYLAAKSYAADLNNQALPLAAKQDATLPGIKALALVLSLPVETVASHVFLILAVFGELSSIILFYLWGASRYERALVGGGQTLDGEYTRHDSTSEQSPKLLDQTQLQTLAHLLSQLNTPQATEDKDGSKKS